MKIVKDLTIIAIFSAIIVVLELALSFLPNIQLTFFLIVLFSKILGLKKSVLIVLIYVLVDNLIMGSIGLYTPFILASILLIPISLNTIFKKVENELALAFLGVLFSFIYCWSLVLATMLMTNTNFIDYMILDIPYEIILACSSFLSILILYVPFKKFLIKKLNIS